MKNKLLVLFTIIGCLILICFGLPLEKNNEIKLLRNRRDLDFEVGANHDQHGGTEITAETIANLWKSKDGKTLIDGSATYSQRFGGFDHGNGNANYGGKLKLKRIYNLK